MFCCEMFEVVGSFSSAMCTSTQMCMYLCVDAVCLGVYVCVYVYVHVYVCVYMYVYVHMCACVCVWVCACTSVYDGYVCVVVCVHV